MKWKYWVRTLKPMDIDSIANEMGEDGWLLVTMVDIADRDSQPSLLCTFCKLVD